MVKTVFLKAFIALSAIGFSQEDRRHLPEHATVVASPRYADGIFLDRVLMGKNYRTAWNTPVTVPVFRVSASGLKIEKLGGSKQTTSLYLTDSHDHQWVIRSVEKNVKKGLPGLLRHTPLRWYKQQLVSAAYPYAAAVVSDLASALGIIAPQPVFCVIADEENLGSYRGMFANKLAMIERVEPTPDDTPTIETDSLLQIIPGNDNKLMEKEFLKARLFDMVVGDWDRHAGQWRWGFIDSGSVKFWYPIPRDRDHALFYTTGFLPALMKLTFEPHLVGFSNNVSKVKVLNKKAWDLDRTLLKNLDENAWREMATFVQTSLTDAVINRAVQNLPEELAVADGRYFSDRLKSRRDDLMPNVMKYYEFVSGKKVTTITTAGVAAQAGSSSQ